MLNCYIIANLISGYKCLAISLYIKKGFEASVVVFPTLAKNSSDLITDNDQHLHQIFLAVISESFLLDTLPALQRRRKTYPTF